MKTIELRSKECKQVNEFDFIWFHAYVDFNFCFNRKVFCYKSNIIAN